MNPLSIKKVIYALAITFASMTYSPLAASRVTIHQQDSRSLPKILACDLINFDLTLPKRSEKSKNTFAKFIKGKGKNNQLAKLNKEEYRIESLHILNKERSYANTIIADCSQDLPQKTTFFIKKLTPLNKFLDKPCSITLKNKEQIKSIKEYLDLRNIKNHYSLTLRLSYLLSLFIVYWNKNHLPPRVRAKLISIIDLSRPNIQKEKIAILDIHNKEIGSTSLVEFIELVIPFNATIKYFNANNWRFIPQKLVKWINKQKNPLQEHHYFQLAMLGHIFHIAPILHIKFNNNLPNQYMTRTHQNISHQSQNMIQYLRRNHFFKLPEAALGSLHLFAKQSVDIKVNLDQFNTFKSNQHDPNQVIWYCANGLRFVIANNGERYGIIFTLRELYLANKTALQNRYIQYKAEEKLGQKWIIWIDIKKYFEQISSSKTVKSKKLYEKTTHLETHIFYKKCNQCSKELNIKRTTHCACGGCKKVRYCNKKCQKRDWKQHKNICKGYLKKSNQQL